jgi:5-methylthioadenosine/S-adenosylhomocysteine deaminase
LIDLLIHHAFILTMVGLGAGVIEDGSIAVDDGTIVAVGKSRKLPPAHRSPRKKIDASGKVVLPGLIDAHVHTHLGLFRGEAQDVPESEWMTKAVEPFKKHLTEDAAVKSARLIAIEGLKAGTTLFSDFGPFVDAAAGEVYAKLGVRANLAGSIEEVGSLGTPDERGLYQFDPDVGKKTFDKNLRLVKRWHNGADGRITCSLGPVAADMLSEQLLIRVKETALEKNMLIHFHLAQGARENAQIKGRYGMSTVEFLDKLGFLCPNVMGVHCHGASDEELRLIAKRGVRMISCPSSIALIDGIVSPVWQFLEAGGYSAALGSDQACGNNSCNMFTEMRMAAFLNKVRSRDPTALPAWKALRLATIDAARTLGLEGRLGSIEKGKRADLIMVNLKTPQTTPILKKPVRNVVPNLVYAATGTEVDTVIVDGRVIMEKRKVLTTQEGKALEEAQKAAERIADRATQDYYEAGSRLARTAEEGLI